MSFLAAPSGWLVLDTEDGEYARVIAWCSAGECLSPVVVTTTGGSGIIPMPSPTHLLVFDPVEFERLS